MIKNCCYFIYYSFEFYFELKMIDYNIYEVKKISKEAFI